MLKKVIYFFVYVICSGVFLFFAYNVVTDATRFSFDYMYNIFSQKPAAERSAREITVTIPIGSSTKQIGEILKEEGLVADVTWFWFQSIVNKSDGNFKPGTYTLSTKMSEDEIMQMMVATKEKVEQITFTVPEGYTVKNIGELLEKQGIVKSSDFINAMNNTNYDYSFISQIPSRNIALEGYLFPDTYFLREGTTSEEIISKMLNRFDGIYDQQMKARTAMLGLTIDQVITMASIIEKEIKVADERQLASAVIYNRLHENMKLQMCSTIMYALGKNKDKLLDSDLEINSPYNTYANFGLPIGPIGNPGYESIRAVLYPAETDYLYFVLKDDETGEHFFTDDFKEFSKAKAEYKQRF